MELDKEFQDPRGTNKIEKNDGGRFLSYEESRKDYNILANKNGAIRAFKVLRNFPRVRESLNTYPKLWVRLNEKIQVEIRANKEELKPPDREKDINLNHYHTNKASIDIQ